MNRKLSSVAVLLLSVAACSGFGAGVSSVRTPVFAPGLADHTAAIQAAIDDAAKAGGGTVWIPPGEYRVSTLALGEGVTLKLAGGVGKATDGYTDEVRRRAMDPKVSAIVRTTGESTIDMFIFNMRTPGYVTNGASNVTLSGGVFDCEGRMKVLAFLCAKNARIENVLVKDLKNDHAIQLDNCVDSVVSNCLFAGYTYVKGDPERGFLTRETVQVEPTRPGAIWKPATSPIWCEDKDNWPCRNVTIADCWFGPSENLGPQLVAVGHHVASRAGNGLRIVGNVIVDPLHCALRFANYSDVVVAGNRFVYTKNPEKLSDDASVVLLWGESRLGKDEKGFVFLDNAFDVPVGFNLPRYTFAPGREKEASVDPVVTVTLSFDDGTRDHLKAAALLEKYGWRGCFNIITDKVGDGGFLTWDEIRDLKRRGHEIASHTASHPSLKKLLSEGKRGEALDELVRSREAIVRETGSAPRYLCHPYIAWNDEVDALIREAGMTPSGHVRYNHGGKTKAGTSTGVGAYLDRKRIEGKLKVDLLFHGVEAGGGWNPIVSIDEFEAALREIKARETAGTVRVLSYGEFMGCSSSSAAERPLVSAGFISDTHVLDRADSCERVGQALRLFRDLGVDLIANVGDIADKFHPKGYAAYRAKFDEVFADRPRPREAYAFAAHDAFSYPDASRRYAATYEQAHQAFEAMKAILKVPHEMEDVIEVGGFPFVVVSSWLKPDDYAALVEKTVKRYPGRPVFVLDHIPPFDTVGNSFFWGNGPRRKVLNRYPQAVHVSGHNHMALRDERAFWQGEFTAVNDGSMSYWGCGGDLTGNELAGRNWQRVESYDALVMDVYADRVEFRRFDVRDGSECRPEARWTTRLPFGGRQTTWTGRAHREIAPQFPSGAQVSFVPDGHGDYTLSFPEASGEARAWRYRVELLQPSGVGAWLGYSRQDFYGDFYRRAADRDGRAERTVSGALIQPDVKIRVRVTPVGLFGAAGDPIETTVHPPAAAAWRPVYTSAHRGDRWKVLGDAEVWRTRPPVEPTTADGWYEEDKAHFWAVEPEIPADAKPGDRYVAVVEAELEGEVGKSFHIALDNAFGRAMASACGKVPWQRYGFEFTVAKPGERHALIFRSMGPARFRPSVVRLLKYVGTGSGGAIRTEDLRVRDPYIVTDAAAGKYYLYKSCPWQGGDGVDAYESRDLKTWTGPIRVMTVPDASAVSRIWAPEVHAYRGKWYLFVTLTAAQGEVKPMVRAGFRGMPHPPRRGTWVFVSDSPKGPFVPTRQGSVTPEDWSALDGTFFEEDGKPHMVFCHEWGQTGDGRMMLAELTADIDGLAREPVELFTATSVGEGRYVTDGPCLFRSPKSGRLFMTWSNGGPKGYAVYLNESASGRLAGPWENRGLFFADDGGHGAFFRKLDGSLAFSLHRPNGGPDERLKVFSVRDDGKGLYLER